MSRALDDVSVIDLTTQAWGSLAGALLGDFGADVIRIEDLSRPARDENRDGLNPPEAFDAEAELIQRNKRSVGLDLSSEAGGALFLRLVAGADVFLTDRAAAELDAAGWDYEALAAGHPGLVYVRGSGFGPFGPDRGRPALDELAAARTGVMPTLPQPGEPPVYAGVGPMYTAVMLALGAVTALHDRATSGEGQLVDASLYGGNLYAATLSVDAYLAMRDDRLCEPVSRLESANPMSGASLSYPTSDGRWITLTMPDSDRWWPAFSEVMGLDVDDPRFDTHDKRCGESRKEMIDLLEHLFAQQPAAHWRRRFDEKRLSADIIERYDYAAGLDQAYLNRYLLNLEHPSYGRYRSVGFPVHLGETPARLHRMAPGIGQHSAEIVAERLGLSDDEIAGLESTGAIGTARPDRGPAVTATDRPVGAPAPGPDAPTPTAAAGGPRPLDGIRVLDLTVWFQGPVCAQYLADFGAEVIHVERPETGDQSRGVASINAVPAAAWNQYFMVNNRNKKSLAVDLKSDGGRRILHDLVARSDVFLWNQNMANLEPLGLDHATLSAINPGLIYTTNSGYGHRGTNRPAFDMTVQALTGIMARLGEPGQPPIYLGLGAGDAYGGLLSALGIMTALHHRRRTGRGQHVDASLLGAQLFLAAPAFQRYLAAGNETYAQQRSRRDTANPLWNRYPTADGWLFVCLDNTDDSWTRLTGVVGSPELTADSRFATAEGRRGNGPVLVDALDAAFRRRGAAEWAENLRAEGIPVEAVARYDGLLDDAQARANRYIASAHCAAAGGEVEFRGLPVTLHRTPGRVETLGPELGQDTEIVLMDDLQLDWDEISSLKASGAIP
ncbi:MAG: CoA transferase [Acidimicrobiia bacterium]